MAPIDATPSFKHKAYAALKNAIVAMDIYRSRDDIRLDERKLAQDFGISRTPVREAMAQLESEGFVRLGAAPRRLCGAQDQARGDRDDHRLGGA
jgi:DNA-binding GntR family transcriptional regulator